MACQGINGLMNIATGHKDGDDGLDWVVSSQTFALSNAIQ
jgi:hypothetical protein